MIYADDNDQLLVNNTGTTDTRAYRQSWVNNIQDWGTSEENTNSAYVLSGKLATYVNNNLRVYKCPSDQSAAQNGPRLRSFSMNSLVGNPLRNPNLFNPTWVQFLKMSQFPGPANFYVFVEEHPDTINDGYFMNRWDVIQWGNLPASWHNGAANISWADGFSTATSVASALRSKRRSMRTAALTNRKPPASLAVVKRVEMPERRVSREAGRATGWTRPASMKRGATLSRSRICFNKRPAVPGRLGWDWTASV